MVRRSTGGSTTRSALTISKKRVTCMTCDLPHGHIDDRRAERSGDQRGGAVCALEFQGDGSVGLYLGRTRNPRAQGVPRVPNDDNGLSYKITGCFPPGAPNTLGAPAFLNCQQTLGFPVVGSPYTYYPTGPFHQDFSNFSPTAGVDFHIDQDMMLYASYSKGYKTGSWTTRLSNPHPTYDSSLHFDPEFADFLRSRVQIGTVQSPAALEPGRV